MADNPHTMDSLNEDTFKQKKSSILPAVKESL
jgi:hypothetical protein